MPEIFDQQQNTPKAAENTAKETKKRGLPLFAKIFYALGLFSIVLFLLFLISPSFADFFNRYISSAYRSILAHLTSWIPFSLAEFLLILSPIIIFLAVRAGMNQNTETWRDVGIYCASMLSVLSLVFSMFTVGFSAGYRGSTLEEKLGLVNDGVTADELYDTAVYFATLTKHEADSIIYESSGFSIMPYGYEQMNDELMKAYDKASDKYEFLPSLNSRVKPVMLSGLMSYTHITGIYTFFTGEANINVAFPDYTVPYTAAHELAHQRGISREDEANFVAFLVCRESDDHYIKYSAYLSMYEYVSNALYKADPQKYYETLHILPLEVYEEMSAYSEFFDKYRDSVASDVSGAINDTFLTIQGTEGIKSYGMVVDLAVAYYNKTIN